MVESVAGEVHTMLDERIATNNPLFTEQVDFLEQIDFVRLDVARKQDRSRKAELGQFLTPAPVARFMASLLEARSPARYMQEIAWETMVWVADHPTHLIHLNGDAPIDPHKKKKRAEA